MSILIITLLFTIPFIILVNTIINESSATITTIKTIIEEQAKRDCSNVFCNTYEQTNTLLQKYNINVKETVRAALVNIAQAISQTSYNYILNIPTMFIKFFIILFMIYYVFIDAERIKQAIEKLLPLQKNNQEIFIDKIQRISHGILYGQLITALLQGTLGTIGFVILGLPNPILWGFIMALFALIPFVGTFIIWGPAAIVLIILGILESKNLTLIKGVILFVYGVLIISTVDNFIKPKIIGKKADVHPLVVLIGIIGGIKVFGLLGIILGPLVLSITITLIKMHNEGSLA